MDFPLEDVPLERRGPLAEHAVRAWYGGRIGRDACARFLGVTAGAPIERVADFFDQEMVAEVMAS